MVPEANWLCWVQWTNQFRGAPWYYSMRNEYLYHYGAVMKFGPAGGAMYGRSPGKCEPFLEEGVKPDPKSVAFVENAPAGAPEYRSGYLYHRVKVQGAKWRFPGTGILPTSERYWGDPACVCLFSRLDADPYGRVFAPDCFRFRVHVLDAAGNLLGEVGRYGNADDGASGQGPGVGAQGSGEKAQAGLRTRNPEPGTRNPEPIHFAWPAFVDAGPDGRLYVSDVLNGRIVVVGFDYADCDEVELDMPARVGALMSRTARSWK
jgi:hypothetical protein